MTGSKESSSQDQTETQSLENDLINHPQHYTRGGIEVIDFITAKGLCYELGNVVKYVARAQYKGKLLQDLKKARWYLDYKIKKLEKERDAVQD